MKIQNHHPLLIYPFLFLIAFFTPAESFSQNIPGSEVSGSWNITVETEEGERPSWLYIKTSGINTLVGKFVGMDGSARPVSKINYSEDNGTYSFTIPPQWIQTDDDMHMEFTHSDGELNGSTTYGSTTLNWTAVRAPELISLEAPEWGEPIELLDEDLSQWQLAENNQFTMEGGVLINKETGGHLITKEKFNDFKISLEFNVPEGSNSGLYLRGRYEVQIMDAYGMKPSSIATGGVYGFIDPIVNASKPAGEWQTLEVTLIGRLVTVVLNGIEVISKRPIPGTTGGALDSNEGEPGPILLQGDHGAVSYRNIVLTLAE